MSDEYGTRHYAASENGTSEYEVGSRTSSLRSSNLSQAGLAERHPKYSSDKDTSRNIDDDHCELRPSRPLREKGNGKDRHTCISISGDIEPRNPQKQLSDKEADYMYEIQPAMSLKMNIAEISWRINEFAILLDKKLHVTTGHEYDTSSFIPLQASSVVSPTAPQSMTSSFITFGPNKDDFVEYKINTRDKTLNKILNALMYIKESPSMLQISAQNLKDIIFRETVHCNLLLAVIGGLPSCGKSDTIISLLKKSVLVPAKISIGSKEDSLQNYEEHGLSSYGVIIVGRKPFDNLIWMPEVKSSMNLFSCASVLFHNSLLQGQQVELVDIGVTRDDERYKVFETTTINDYLHQIYEDVDMLLHQGDLNPEIKRILPSGITAVNIIDAAMNQGVYDFLVLSAGYCHRQFGFVFLDLERDIPRLYQSPDPHPERESVLQLNHRLHYLVRFAAVSYFSANCSSALFIALHNGKLPKPEVQKHVDTLRKAIDQELLRQRLPKDMVGVVLAINKDNEDDMIEFKKTVEAFVKCRSNAMLNLKLNWVFLRSFLQNNSKYSKMISIPLNQIRGLAKEMQIVDSEVEEFLQTYTEFGSLLHLKDILPKHVILQPAVFVNHMQSLYYLEDRKIREYGIISMPDVNKALGEEAEKIVVPFITESGLGVTLDDTDIFFTPSFARGRKRTDSFVYFKTSELFLFIPSARQGEYDSKKDLSSLYIVYKSKVLPSNMAGTFLKRLLGNISTKLIPSKIRNSFSVRLKNDAILTVTFFQEVIGLKLHPFSNDIAKSEIWEEILSWCIVALNKIAEVFRDLTYKFALKCLDSESEKFENIVGADSLLCDKCKVFPKKGDARKRWHDAVKVVGGRKSETVELLNLQSLTQIAKTLTNNEHSHLKSDEKEKLRDALDIDKDEQRLIQSKYTDYQQILQMLLTWVTKIGAQNATKQNLAKILFSVKPSAHVVHMLHDNPQS